MRNKQERKAKNKEMKVGLVGKKRNQKGFLIFFQKIFGKVFFVRIFVT